MASPGPVLYLDVDDEITSAAARIRAAGGTRVALVIPPGSRIATSRINFRLLARDATLHGRQLAIIAPDAASRSLAAAAGLDVFASVGEYEASTEGGAPPASGGVSSAAAAGAAAGAVAAGAAAGALASGAAGALGADASETVVRPPDAATPRSDSPGPPGTPPGPPPARQPVAADELRPRSAAASTSAAGVRSRRGWFGGRGVTIALSIALIGAIVVVGVVGYLLLPSASIVVLPNEEALGPVSVTVTADPEATSVDPASGTVPAERLTFEVAASGTYDATGARVVETKATGTVRWQNCDPTESYTIAAGTVVRTSEGVRFVTAEEVFLPVAVISFPTIQCQTRDVGVEAVEAGPAGNVAAGAITVIPGSLNSVVISVTNRAPTTGGSRESFPRVTQGDVDAALADLDAQLAAAFAAELAAPDAVAPGLTLFPETAALGPATVDPDPAGLVGAEIPSFELSSTASGTAIAVDEAPIGQVAEARLAESLEPGFVLVEGSIESTVGEPTVAGETVVFPASATAVQVRVLDPAELEALVLGMTPEEAEDALAPYGASDIVLWPDWASTIPTFEFRVELTVDGPTIEASPSVEPSRAPSTGPSASPSTSPAASPSAAPSAVPSS